jgi:3-oxoacyl-[acyl-carrier protein] reductase
LGSGEDTENVNVHGKNSEMLGRVLVTGGAGSIGMAICRKLRDVGWTPISGDLPKAIELVDTSAKENLGIEHIELDVTSRESVDAAVKNTGGEWAGVVNCAGVLRDTLLGRTLEESMNFMFQVNLAGTARVTDAFATSIRDGGAIVNIGSVTGYIGRFVGASVYGATKAGVGAYTTYLAVELASRGIRVNNVAPGVIRAPMSPSMALVSGGEESSAAQAILNRIGEPEEVAEVVEFLLSERASFITAQTILVDGGFVAR